MEKPEETSARKARRMFACDASQLPREPTMDSQMDEISPAVAAATAARVMKALDSVENSIAEEPPQTTVKVVQVGGYILSFHSTNHDSQEEEPSPKKVEQKTNKEVQQKQEPTPAVPAPSATTTTTFRASDFLPSGGAEEEEEPEEESQSSQPITTFRFKAAHFTPSDPLNAWDEADSSSSAAAPPPPPEVSAAAAAPVSSSDKEQGKSTEAPETERSESDTATSNTANTVIHMPSRMPKVIVDSTESTGTDPDTSDTVQEVRMLI